MNRVQVRKQKRKKKKGFILLALLLLIGAGVFYWVYQYNQGVKEASDSTVKDKDFELFEGEEPKFGEINVMLLGSDARKDEDGRSDTLMVANYNQKTEEVKLISIMRDTYVSIPGHGRQKMNAAYSYGGPELVRQTLKENFNLDVHYYAIVDFNGFPKIVDLIAPDGIEVDIPYTMQHGIGMTLQPGKQTLHGEQLLGYVRFRHDKMSDFGRVERQQEALSKLKDEAVGFHSLVNLPKLLGTADTYVNTNLDKKTILSIAKGILENKSGSLQTLRVPVNQSYVDRRVDVGEVLDIDFDKNIQAIDEFLNPTVDTAADTTKDTDNQE
ncbi:LCP family protein [Sporosarcina sp. Te-1]|uniref:LCP family protein n=1 Tax=Sporosarcina sp. Te-1 TaxID=2818390 RepID=UPI001A9DEDB0|nr:LCP family protein [Sporosarcina sp. Te-1]QTD41797.1 LCP family protein [Sporosarcina sp. Te-1]